MFPEDRSFIRTKAMAVLLNAARTHHAVIRWTDASKEPQDFHRLVGGSVELGELAVDAVVREIGEELGTRLCEPRLLGVLENLFVYEGEPGHEIVFVYAGELADPKLIIGIDNIPTDGADRFNLTREFMTMRKIGFMQDFTRAEKLQLRGDRAAAEVQKETAILALSKFNLRRDVALAWIERYFAERQLDLLKTLARESKLQVATADATLAGGKGQANDPFAARLAVAQLADRAIDAERNIARARATLSRWIGVAAARQPLDAAPAFDQLNASSAIDRQS